MVKRELIVREIEKRLWNIKQINGYSFDITVFRNPIDVPVTFPCVNIYEMDDKVVSRDKSTRFTTPTYKRELEIIIEAVIECPDESTASIDLFTLYEDIRKALFADGDGSLGGLGELYEKAVSRPVTVPSYRALAVWILFGVEYIDRV